MFHVKHLLLLLTLTISTYGRFDLKEGSVMGTLTE